MTCSFLQCGETKLEYTCVLFVLPSVTKISIWRLKFWPKFRFFVKIWIFGESLNFSSKFGFLAKVWIFRQNLDFWPKYGFFVKIWIFYPIWIFGQIRIFGQNLNFCPKLGFFSKLEFLPKNLDFWPKFESLFLKNSSGPNVAIFSRIPTKQKQITFIIKKSEKKDMEISKKK